MGLSFDLKERKQIKNGAIGLPKYEDGTNNYSLVEALQNRPQFNPSYTPLVPDVDVRPGYFNLEKNRVDAVKDLIGPKNEQITNPTEIQSFKDRAADVKKEISNGIKKDEQRKNLYNNIGNIATALPAFAAQAINASQYSETANDILQRTGMKQTFKEGKLPKFINGLDSGYPIQYSVYNAIDKDAIHAEEHGQNVQNTLGLMGTGATMGATFGPIGAAAGAVLGGVAGLFGAGKRNSAMRRAIRDAEMKAYTYNNFSRNDALTNALRQSSFKDGKMPKCINGKTVYSAFGPVDAKADSLVSKGEVAMDLKTGSMYRIPTGPNDTARFAGGKDPNIAIISNKYGLSDQAMVDPIGALNRQKALKDFGYLSKNKDGFANGKLGWSNLLAHGLGGLIGLNQYFDAKNQSVYRPNTYVRNPYGNRGLGILSSLRVNPLPIINQLRNAEARTNYALNSSGGLSGAQRYIGRTANLFGTQRNIADTLAKIQEQNNAYRQQYASAAMQYGAQEAANMMNSRRADDDVYMRSHAARQSGMQMGLYNILNNLQQYAANEYKRRLGRASVGIYDKDLMNIV